MAYRFVVTERAKPVDRVKPHSCMLKAVVFSQLDQGASRYRVITRDQFVRKIVS